MEPELKPVRTGDRSLARGAAYERDYDAAAAAQGQKVLRNTYLLLALTMVPTVITGVYLSLFNIFANLLYLPMALSGERE